MSAQQEDEVRIFTQFAEASGLPIRKGSVVGQDAPDIQCEIEGEGSVAFELVEVVDQDLTRRYQEANTLETEIYRAYEALAAEVRQHVEQRCGNAVMVLSFQPSVSHQRRKNAIPDLFEYLATIDPELAGMEYPTGRPKLNHAIQRICIARGDFTGPLFEVNRNGFFADPLLDRVRSKFRKRYGEKTPLELLVYYDSQPVLPEGLWRSDLERFLAECRGFEPYRRVWVLDVSSRKVRFVWTANDRGR